MLKLENINITFNKNTANERKALQHIDLDVADGDFVTVIGSNGAGKSTLMNVISGSYEADTGKIFLDGKNITHLKEHQRARTIGRLFQDRREDAPKHDHRGKSRPCLQSWKASFAYYRYQEKGRFSVQRKAQGA